MNNFPRNEVNPLDTSKSVNFQITDWFIPETDKQDYSEDPQEFSILMYGTDDNGETYCTKITGFRPFFYIKPINGWENLSKNAFYDKVQELQNHLENDKYESVFKDRTTGEIKRWNKSIISQKYTEHFLGLDVVEKKDFWGFTNNTIFRYIKITTKSLALFNSLKYYFMQNKKEDFKLYESNIDPFLRYIHIQNIKPCGWVKINKYKLIKDEPSRCNHNIEVKWNNVIPLEKNKIAPMIVASFDIECTSSHGDFPVAKKDYKKLSQDLATFAKQGYDIDADCIKSWIYAAYSKDIEFDDFIINRLYPKNKVDKNKIYLALDKVIKDIISILNKISEIDIDENSDDDDDDNVAASKPMTVKEYNALEDELNMKLTKVLPKLEGDKIIQIGTTVHKFGSSDIIYRNIITLNSCDNIESVDVISCKTEKELIMKWKDLLNELNPDILTGYNIFGFDMEYLWVRVLENDILDEFSVGLGRLVTRKSSLIEQKLASSAMGENILKYFDLDGIVVIDLLKVMQKDQKLDSYKLDNVASIFLGDKKDDLKPHELFEKFKGNSADRCVIAKYCIQDCALVNRLLHKLKIIENNLGMGNVCLVPLNFLFKRGQGIKIFSLIAKECMNNNLLIPVIKYQVSDYDMDEGYEGAIVLEPKEGIYLNEPIVVFDYGSLYPSSMIARNLSHDTYVLDKKYMVNDPNIEYITVKYDLYEGIGAKKVKTGVKECIFAKYKDGKKGTIAEILEMLLRERKNTRKKIEYKSYTLKDGSEVIGLPNEKDDLIEVLNIDKNETITINKKDIDIETDTYNEFEQAVFDALQLAYKITANSLYGQIGAKTSPIYLKDIAACTTATGREMIVMAKEFVETNYNADVIYGDSVMPYTPITINNNGNIEVSTFEKLDGNWVEYNNFKPNDTDRFEKEQYIPENLKVWTHKGWANIKRVIRHKTTKKIYRVLTHTGLVDVTEDHSLLDTSGNIIKPGECDIGQELLHSKPEIDFKNIIFKVNQDYQESIQQEFIKLTSMGKDICIKYDGKFIILCYNNLCDTNPYAIKKLEVLHESYNGYVYDIETEYGVFHGGIGNIILKNTDSIFCKFPLKDSEGNEVLGKDSLPYAIEVGKHVEKNIAKFMPKPQKLNYEKSLFPFILFSKKRYVGNLYEFDVNKFKQKSMGIVLKRRDNANIVKKIYGGVIDIILNKQDINLSIEFLKDELEDLVSGKADIKDLVISKTLRGSYKDPTKIAHKVLADRIAARDPGNKPATNERIPYVYIKAPDAKLQGDKIENPEYILENSITIDYLFYITNQIMKPVLQLYALCLMDLPGNEKDVEYWLNIEEELKEKPIYQDDTKRKNRMDKLKLRAVQELLFNSYIERLAPSKKKKTTKATGKIRTIEDIQKEDSDTVAKSNTVVKKTTKKTTKTTTKNETKTNSNELDAVIKITKSTKTGIISASAKLNDKKKLIWDYKNEDVKCKENETIKIISAMVSDNPNFKLIIKLNNKSFIKNYIKVIAKYSEFVDNMNDNLVQQALKTNDVGRIKDMKDIIKFEELLKIKDKFKLVE